MMEDYTRYKKTQELYDSCEDFHKYVNKCCNSYGYSLEFAFSVRTIQDVGDYMAKAHASDNDICPCGRDDFEEDKSC